MKKVEMGVGIVHHCDGEKKEDGEGGMERNFISDISARSLRVRHDKALGFLVASFIIFDDEMRKEKKKRGKREKSRGKQIKGRRQCHDGNYIVVGLLARPNFLLNLIAIPSF